MSYDRPWQEGLQPQADAGSLIRLSSRHSLTLASVSLHTFEII